MATSTVSRKSRSASAPAEAKSSHVDDRPAATAVTRVSVASLALGAAGLASAIFVVLRLLESWRVSARAASNRISIFGLHLSYPAANFDAIVIIVLAVIGAVVVTLALAGAAREVAASRRLHRLLARQDPQPLRGALLIVDPEPRARSSPVLPSRARRSRRARACPGRAQRR